MARFFILILSVSTFATAGCKKSNTAPEVGRTYVMGFQNSAPRYDQFDLFIQSLNIWTSRADAATVTLEVPWDSLYNGVSPELYIERNITGLVNFYRSRNLEIWMAIDPQNGLNRSSEATGLIQRGKSIADADVQFLFRKFVVAMDSMLRPSHLSVAMETNLIRLAAPPSVYQGVKKAANDAALAVRSRNNSVKLSFSVQVETAWGYLQGNKQYLGIEQDLADFPFADELGISSYPYFGFSQPEDIPINYYTRLLNGRTKPVYIAEGGWSTVSFKAPNAFNVNGTEAIQKRYFSRHHTILNEAKAKAWFQLVFTDLDTTALPPNVDPSIRNFAFLGLLDKSMQSKPALATWDSLYKLPLKR